VNSHCKFFLIACTEFGTVAVEAGDPYPYSSYLIMQRETVAYCTLFLAYLVIATKRLHNAQTTADAPN